MDYIKEIINLELEKPSGCNGSLIPGNIKKSEGPTFIVFGLNPAEAKDDLEDFYDTKFYTINPETLNTLGQRRWTKKISDILPIGSNIIQAEIIYWTSKNRSSLEKRIGELDFGNPYFDLSCAINHDLLLKNQNYKCILLGFSHVDLFEKVFNLPKFNKTVNGEDGNRLVCTSTKSNIFNIVRHPSSIGFSNADKNNIRNILS